MYIGYFKSNKTKLKIVANEKNLIEIKFIKDDSKDQEENENEVIKKCKKELEEYFSGNLKEFKTAFEITGTEFQKRVWKELLNVKYGETISYKQLALNVGNIKAVRAVANAVGKNKIGIIIPCHRIIGSNGSLTGFGGGLENKKYLLEIEKAI